MASNILSDWNNAYDRNPVERGISSDKNDRMGGNIKMANKSLGLQTTPQKSPKTSNDEFPSHKNFQKATNDITITNLQIVLNTQKIPS